MKGKKKPHPTPPAKSLRNLYIEAKRAGYFGVNLIDRLTALSKKDRNQVIAWISKEEQK